MASYFPTFTPRTPNLAKVWEGFNPAANFLGGMKTVEDMRLERAAEGRLREKNELDMMVSRTLLPYKVAEAQANIQGTMALAGLRARQAEHYNNKLTETNSWLDTLEEVNSAPIEDLRNSLGTLPTGSKKETGTSSQGGAGDYGAYLVLPDDVPNSRGESSDSSVNPLFEELDFGDEDELDESDLFWSLPAPQKPLPGGMTNEQLTDPRYAIASAQTGVSTDAPPRSAEMGVLKAREEDDAEAASVFDYSPDEAGETPSGPGKLFSQYIRDTQAASEGARRATDKNERMRFAAIGQRLQQDLLAELSTQYGIDDPAVSEALLKGRGGLRRSAEDIDAIYNTMKNGGAILKNDQGVDTLVPINTWSDAIQAVETQKNIANFLKTQKGEQAPPAKDIREFANLANTYFDMATKAVNPEQQEELRQLGMTTARKGVPSEILPQLISDRQRSLIGMTQFLSQPEVNYKGEPMESTEEKIDAGTKIQQSAGIDYPVVSAELLPDGQVKYDANAISEINKWYGDNNLKVPEGMIPLMGLRIKTDKGIKVYPVQGGIGKDKDGSPLLQTRSAYMELPKFDGDKGGETDTAGKDRSDTRTQYADAGLKARELFGKSGEMLDRSVIATALNIGNVGPAMTNVASGLYEAGEAFITGKKPKTLPRYRLYDGSDVDRVYKNFSENPLNNLP